MKQIENEKIQKLLSWLCLGFGFMVIWTFGISGLLLLDNFDNYHTAQVALKIFNTKQNIGQIVFALGQEMISTVDWLLSREPTRNSDGDIKEAIAITWKATDATLNKIFKNSAESWIDKSDDSKMISVKVNEFRSSLTEDRDPLDAIYFYLNLCSTIDRRSDIFETHVDHNQDPFFIPISSISYNLFNEGLSKRFAEIALGTFYVKSNLSMKTSEYLYLHHVSRELIKKAFSFTPSEYLRYSDILQRDSQPTLALVKDILSGGSNRGSNHLASQYLDGVKDDIALLLLAKDVLNTTLSARVKNLLLTRYNTISFHFSLAIITLIAVIICLTFICFFIKHSNYQVKIDSKPGSLSKKAKEANDTKKSIYSVNSMDKSYFLPSSPIKNFHFSSSS